MSYHIVRVDTPPSLRQRDGGWFIVTIYDGTEIEAPVGQWFLAEVMVRLVVPTVFPLEIQGSHNDKNPPPVPEGKG